MAGHSNQSKHGKGMGIKAPDSVTADKTFTIPDGHGSTGQVLSCSNGTGTLAWTTPTVYQTADADLTAIAGLTSAADKGIQFTGSGSAGSGSPSPSP